MRNVTFIPRPSFASHETSVAFKAWTSVAFTLPIKEGQEGVVHCKATRFEIESFLHPLQGIWEEMASDHVLPNFKEDGFTKFH